VPATSNLITGRGGRLGCIHYPPIDEAQANRQDRRRTVTASG
jgi:hypothetical protein